MGSKYKRRYIAYIAILVVFVVLLSIPLYTLTMATSEAYVPKGSKNSTAELTVPGMRGSIYDANGVLLAYDKESYDVVFYKDPTKSLSSDRANYTGIIIQIIEIIERYEGKVIDDFMVKKDDEGNYVFDISAELTDSQRDSRIDNWYANMQVTDTELTPEEAYYELRARFRIPESVEYEQAHKILSIWQAIQMNIYKAYEPVKIASNVSFETVAELESHKDTLIGVEIQTGTTRVYPKNEIAGQIIGYLGRMTEKEAEKYTEDGYSLTDLVGKSGLESTMEQYLSGARAIKRGVHEYKLNENGGIAEELSYTPPQKGDNVILTLDIGLQEVAEQALKDNVNAINQEQKQMVATDPTKYNKLLSERSKQEISYIESGAAIVMEVKTGNVLAMVSYPSYDINLFTGGISDEDYKAIQEAPGSPLFDKAISSTSTPGSIFKMATAVAGLMEGTITLNTYISDEGPYNEHISGNEKGPACWIDPYFSSHSNQNVTTALKNSCNYFFFKVADDLGIEKLTEWVGKLGLLEKTGIELSNEIVGFMGGQKTIYDKDKDLDNQKTYRPQLIYSKLITQLKEFGQKRDVTYTEDKLDKAALALMALTNEGNFGIGPEIRQVLSEHLDIPENVSLRRGWTSTIMDTIRELIWTQTDTVTQGIGATPIQLSPIAVARYMAALGNGGKVFEAHLVDKIVDSDNNVVEDIEPTLVRDLALPESYMKAIWEGMEQVVSAEHAGTAGNAFRGFEYQSILMGKTGTAPISNIDIEDNVWLCLLAPKNDPEIAVVIFLPNGLGKSGAYPTAKAIIKHYFDAKKAAEGQTPDEGSLVG